MIILIADHVEGKCFHSEPETFTHAGDAFDDNTRAPLIVKLPESKHEIRKELVSNVDVFKIILDMLSDQEIKKIAQKYIVSIRLIKQEIFLGIFFQSDWQMKIIHNIDCMHEQ